MRVLQINAVYEKFSTGRTTKELHMVLQKQGHESYIAAQDIGELKENAYQIGNKWDWKIHALMSRISGKQGYFSIKATKKLIRYISLIKPDIVHLRVLHSNYINIVMLLKFLGKNNIATVITLHDSFFYTGKCVYYIEDNCYKWKEKCGDCPALKKGNPSLLFDCTKKMLRDKRELFAKIEKLAVVGVSEWVTKDAAESILCSAKIIKRIYNWIDLERFQPRDTTQLKQELGLNGKIIILGIAMSWNPLKGIEIFLQLADLLPENYQIVLVGECDQNKYSCDKIQYLGEVMDIDYLAKLYSMADVFVNPTIQETFGKTTAEALACGTPVVAYNATAMPELIPADGSCGELVNQFSAEAFIEKIMMVEENNYSNKLKCRERAIELFDKKNNINEYIRLYQNLIKNKEIA